eukprot:1188196-Prorocentrum_minimum.AAC.1
MATLGHVWRLVKSPRSNLLGAVLGCPPAGHPGTAFRQRDINCGTDVDGDAGVVEDAELKPGEEGSLIEVSGAWGIVIGDSSAIRFGRSNWVPRKDKRLLTEFGLDRPKRSKLGFLVFLMGYVRLRLVASPHGLASEDSTGESAHA